MISPVKINSYLLQLIAFALPLSKRVVPPLIILWVLNTLFFIGFNKKRLIKQPLPSLPFWIYLLYGVYYFISPEKDSASFDLEVKLSLLLFPLGFYFTGNYLPRRDKIIKAFLYGITVGVLAMWGRALFRYWQSGNSDYLGYSELSFIMHTSYYAMYVSWALFILITNYFSAVSKRYFPSYVYWALFVLFTVTIFLLASKTGIIVWLLLMLYAVVLFYLTTRKIGQILMVLFSGIALFVLLLSANKKLFLRFREAYHVLVLNESGKAFSSTTARSRIWPLAVDLIKQQPLGYGTGAEKATLTQAYLKNDMTEAYEKQLNAHNQFLQTALAIGILGLLLLIILFIRFLVVGYIYDEWLLFGFAFITMVNFITESMLETQAGVVFFAFFYTLLDAYFKRDYSYLRKKTLFLRL